MSMCAAWFNVTVSIGQRVSIMPWLRNLTYLGFEF